MEELQDETVAELNPLGHASPDRYVQGEWPKALLDRMVYWASRMHTHGKFLDLGCGEGALLQQISGGAFGADLNPERLALSVKKKLSVTLADGCLLPFADETFDTVISMEVLEHVPEMAVMMREVQRVLKPGGHWVVSVPGVTLRSWYEMKKDQRPYYCDEHEHFREFTAVDIDWFEHKFMRTDLFETMFREQGFSVRHRDGVRYLFPQWLSRIPALQRLLETPSADRIWSALPVVNRFPFWMIRVLYKP
jgi:2-polyprenyl-3-methyl-5-hydroxy-6-metoxy-1,4-benzoquinol methylase